MKKNRFQKRWGFLLGVLLLTIGNSWAQSVRVYGYVLDRERKPIEFANVKVKGRALGASTNLKGYYSFSLPLSTDSLIIEFSSLGYRSVQKTFPKGIQADLRLNVELPETATEINTVTVVASQKKQQNMERISAENIRINSSPTGGVESLVSTYAGVTQNNELSSQYSVRGGSYDENMVYVNGMEVYRPLLVRSAQQEGLSFVNPEMTRSVNFSAGGFTAEYGDKMSSVLDIRYKIPDRFEASAEAGLQGSQLYIGSRHGAFTQVTGVRFKNGKALLNTFDTKGEYEPLYFDAQTYLTFRLNKAWMLHFLGNTSSTHYSFIPQTRETSFGTLTNAKTLKIYFDGRERDHFLSFFGSLGVSFTPSTEQRHSLNIGLYNSKEEETYDIEGAYYLDNTQLHGESKNSSDISTNLNALATGTNLEHARNRLSYTLFTASYNALWKVLPAHTLKGGISYRRELVSDHISEWTRRDSAGYNQPRQEERIEMLYNLYSSNSLQSHRWAGYLMDEVHWETSIGAFSLYPGVRASYWSFNKEFIISPRLVTSFSPKSMPKVTFRFASGLYYQAPFYKEIRTTVTDANGNNEVHLNPSIRSQGSLHFLVGSDYQFKIEDRNFRLSTELYYKHLYHLNPYVVDNVKVRYLGDNIGKGYIAGVDVKLFGEFVPGVDSWLTASLLKSQQHIPNVGSMALPNAPNYNFSLFFQDYFPGYKKLRLSLRGVLSGGLPQFRPSRNFEMPAFTGASYKRVDMGLIYRLYDEETLPRRRMGKSFLSAFKSIDISLEFFNLLDNANVSGYYWITDAFNHQYAVPNYLTRRQINVRLRADF
ncbi:TonB-dependent receptor [Porphyromonas gingivicanis]|uniref:TonB-dependent receptor n=1 Tax=Porphyromonas gingivicanis TaxID=266762 RepID=UPI000686186B|nr:TonB-dependent receptor [Porphyromonas gingivicanis]